MAKKKMVLTVLTGCPDPKRREEFERWYMHTHLPDLKNTVGLVRARRFKNRVDENPSQTMTIYEFEHNNLDECIGALQQSAGEAIVNGRHIDIFDLKGFYMWEEIEPSSLKPLEKVDYPKAPPKGIGMPG